MTPIADKTVFISYAHEDAKFAERLYKDLKQAGLIPWRDKEAIRPGENWKIVIRKAIKNTRYFIPLFSSNSSEKIGYIQKEFKYAIDTCDKFPESQIYIIPVRLDNCQISYEKLEELQYADLFPDWTNGVTQILAAMGIETSVEKKEIQHNKEVWKMGLSDEDWTKLLTSIYKKECIPFIGAGIYTVQSEDGKTLLPSSKVIIDKWKEENPYPLDDLYELARVYALEDSYQLARLAQFLEIGRANEMYPKQMLSHMLEKIDLSDFYSRSRKNSPFNILANLDLPIYITTNYDNFFEYTVSKSRNREPQSELCRWNDELTKYCRALNISSVFDSKDYKPSTEKPLVYHILGDISIPQSMVLTERDYFEYVINLNKNEEKDMIPSVIRTKLGLGGSSLLFIGYSLEDVNFRAIFQGFLSFLSALPKKYRQSRLSIAVQIPPVISRDGQVKMQTYLDEYTKNMFDVHIYWGTTSDFIKDLNKRWEDYRNMTDTKECSPLKEIK